MRAEGEGPDMMNSGDYHVIQEKSFGHDSECRSPSSVDDRDDIEDLEEEEDNYDAGSQIASVASVGADSKFISQSTFQPFKVTKQGYPGSSLSPLPVYSGEIRGEEPSL